MSQQSHPSVESLENRTFLSVSPMIAKPAKVATAYFDNRGRAVMTFTVGLNPNTLSGTTASIYKAGPDNTFGTADDLRLKTSVSYKKGRLTIGAATKVNQRYRVRLDASVIRDVNGRALDGEFNGIGKQSGNGRSGGSYDVVTNRAATTFARFTTTAGFIHVQLFGSTKPITVANFAHYMNEGAWDTTFFHRSVPGFVVQGGGFNISSKNQLGNVHSEGTIKNEPGISNTRGTIAMARTSAVDSATNQWFFNLANNAANLDNQNQGFTVFGQVLNDGSLQVMDKLATYSRVNAESIHPAFEELPVTDAPALQTRALNPSTDLIRVTRVAQLMNPSKTTVVASKAVPAVTPAPAASAVVSPLLAKAFSALKIEEDASLLA
jgi:peptidyl-prolyl cis-trans isomerase A (cyclophilin A)